MFNLIDEAPYHIRAMVARYQCTDSSVLGENEYFSEYCLDRPQFVPAGHAFKTDSGPVHAIARVAE